jgi:hypothetical protein
MNIFLSLRHANAVCLSATFLLLVWGKGNRTSACFFIPFVSLLLLLLCSYSFLFFLDTGRAWAHIGNVYGAVRLPAEPNMVIPYRLTNSYVTRRRTHTTTTTTDRINNIGGWFANEPLQLPSNSSLGKIKSCFTRWKITDEPGPAVGRGETNSN